MKRALGFSACTAIATVLLSFALTSTPTTSVEAAPTDAGPAASSSATPGSIYLTKAAGGAVLPPSVDDAEAFCALALACRDVPLFPPAPDFAGCVKSLMDMLSGPGALNSSVTIRECGLAATSCKNLRTCLLKGADPKVCDGFAMTSDTPIGKCDVDARAVTCWRGKVLGVRNCGMADELCVVKSGKADCALAGPCPAGAKDEWTCAGSRMVKCQDGKFLSIDCKVLNLTCNSYTDDKGKQQVGCAPPTPAACKMTNTYTCSGKHAMGCVNGKEVKIDCGEAGMTCADPKAPTEKTVGACELPAPTDPKLACDPKKFEAKCDGAMMVYCSSGTIRKYPCKSIGATKCVMEKGTGPRCG
ncbi:MAG: hypothetical protein HYV09_33865 [Deltaproteobacteria bacterium]|nr:hypothetical protein [Deltaproteobacteria bacterium]